MGKISQLFSLSRVGRSKFADIASATAALAILFLLGSCATNCGCDRGASEPHLTLALGPEWTCKLDKTEHVCHSVVAGSDRAIIWTMKDKGPDDTFEKYREHLATPLAKAGLTSTPVSVKEIELSGTLWLDAVQRDSEIKGCTTRYLTTIDQNLAVLVTFSARTAEFDNFSSDMQPLIDRLVVRR